MIEFETWGKTPRLNKDMTITEKIDGSNAAIIVEPLANDVRMSGPLLCDGTPGEKAHWLLENTPAFAACWIDGDFFMVGAQSRKRLITPGGSTDMAGFAAWVQDHATDLVRILGVGRHFGEWWGKGIQRGYGLDAKRFYLFNTHRYANTYHAFEDGTEIDHVPVLYHGPFSTPMIDFKIEELRQNGSMAARGFMRPEGVIVHHSAANQVFKAFLEGDDTHKGEQ